MSADGMALRADGRGGEKDWGETMDGSGALLAATALMLTLLAVSRRRRGAGLPSGRRGAARTRVEWHGGYSPAFQRSLDVLQALEGEIVAADPNRGTITARMRPSAVSLAPLGASAHVCLTTRDGVTFVDVEVVPMVQALGRTGAMEVASRFAEAWDRLPSPSSSRAR